MPSDEAIEELVRVQTELRVLGSGRFARRDRLHLTLRFIGEADAAGLERARRMLDDAAAACPPLRLELGPLGAFRDIAHARVGGDAAALSRLSVSLGGDAEFRPHITLARDFAPPSRWPDIAPVRWTAAEAVLFESVLGPQARYLRRHAAPLTGG